MNQSFFSSISELIARVVSLILILFFFTIFYLARNSDFRMSSPVGFGVLISGSVILYELLAFVFYEIFSFIEHKTLGQVKHEEQAIQEVIHDEATPRKVDSI